MQIEKPSRSVIPHSSGIKQSVEMRAVVDVNILCVNERGGEQSAIISGYKDRDTNE